MQTPSVNSPESFGIQPGTYDYDTFINDSPSDSGNSSEVNFDAPIYPSRDYEDVRDLTMEESQLVKAMIERGMTAEAAIVNVRYDRLTTY